MKPTTDDFQPRRDGWFEHKGTWGEVTVGTVLASHKRSERWEVIDTRAVTHAEYGKTLWFRIREQTTGQEHTIPPKSKVATATILTRDPRDTETPPVTPCSDAEAIALLVKELGAEVMATRDEETGEITCPDYTYESHIPGTGDRQISRGLIEHLRFAHQYPVNDGVRLEDLITLHGQAHNPKWPNIGKGGFPHRHVPEDMTLITGGRP